MDTPNSIDTETGCDDFDFNYEDALWLWATDATGSIAHYENQSAARLRGILPG
jgi:hypothetical protein